MKNIIFLTILLFSGFAASAQNIPSYNADKLVKRILNKDTTYIVNFWASWCGPCVKELPEFDKLNAAYNGKPVKVILASLDFKEFYPEKLNSYVRIKKITPEVVWFNETNANEFIPKIDTNWSGALPATLIVNARTKYHTFIERQITSEEIQQLVAESIK